MKHELPSLGRIEAVVGRVGQPGVVETIGLFRHAAAVEAPRSFIVTAQMTEGERGFGAKGRGEAGERQFRGLFLDRVAECDNVFPAVLRAQGGDLVQQARTCPPGRASLTPTSARVVRKSPGEGAGGEERGLSVGVGGNGPGLRHAARLRVVRRRLFQGLSLGRVVNDSWQLRLPWSFS